MLTKVLGEAKAFYERCRTNASIAWYRGHAESGWELKSTLHRHVEEMTKRIAQPISPTKMRGVLRDEYQKTYRVFMNDAWPLLKDLERSDWGVIFAMQHYGLPTRLLDWTESFACALYFAHRTRSPDKAAAIWALNPQALNQLTVQSYRLIEIDDSPSAREVDFSVEPWHPRFRSRNENSDKILPCIAVTPLFTNPRMTAQRAAFTLMGDSFLDLDHQCDGQLIRDGHLMRIELGPETYGETEDYLMLAGCSAFTFFPDLDGLAQRHKAETVAEIRDAKKYWPHLVKDEKG